MTDSSVILAWRPPADLGGTPIKRYLIEKREPSKISAVPVATCDGCLYKVGRLVSGTDYIFGVAAENEVGRGAREELIVRTSNPKSQSHLFNHIFKTL